jgi:hypothetical protein
MNEDEAFDEIAERIANAPKVVAKLHAISEAQRFIEGYGAAELGIMTLRKAFEEGYRLGWLHSITSPASLE